MDDDLIYLRSNTCSIAIIGTQQSGQVSIDGQGNSGMTFPSSVRVNRVLVPDIAGESGLLPNLLYGI